VIIFIVMMVFLTTMLLVWTLPNYLQSTEDLRIAEEDLKNKKAEAAQAKAEFYAMIEEQMNKQ
jgi:hypothetical protein